jgi:hypothetical protein
LETKTKHLHVYFAHEVSFHFTNIDPETATMIKEWYLHNGFYNNVLKIEHNDRVYMLNRDYICAIVE